MSLSLSLYYNCKSFCNIQVTYKYTQEGCFGIKKTEALLVLCVSVMTSWWTLLTDEGQPCFGGDISEEKDFSPRQTETAKRGSRLSLNLITIVEFHGQNASVCTWWETENAACCRRVKRVCVCVLVHSQTCTRAFQVLFLFVFMCTCVCVLQVTDLEPSQPSGANSALGFLSLSLSLSEPLSWINIGGIKKLPKMKTTEWNLEEAAVNPQQGRRWGGRSVEKVNG